MIVPNCHVQELITETQPDNWVRVTGVRVWQNGDVRLTSCSRRRATAGRARS